MDGNKIVVGLTVRGKDADKFWFSFFHEMAHVCLGHVCKDEVTKEDEEAADLWADDVIIPSEEFDIFMRQGDFSRETVREYASKHNIATGILVGRMQKKGMIKYNMLNDLKQKYVME